MELHIETSKQTVFESVDKLLAKEGFQIIVKDQSRPWGGFFVIDESQAKKFIEKYFSHLSIADFASFEKLSPKILVVAPKKRLSWQYHNRRSEIWKLIHGVAGIVSSETDEETAQKDLQIDQVVNLKCGERHRLVGTEGWGIIAEIWQHTDKENPSNEDDIIRVQDDFGR